LAATGSNLFGKDTEALYLAVKPEDPNLLRFDEP
jgi:hypothetical protein